MKKMVAGYLFVLLFGVFVGAGSEISTSFVVDSPSKKVVNYVPSGIGLDSCLGYFFAVLVALVLVYFIFKKKKVKKKSVKRKKKR